MKKMLILAAMILAMAFATGAKGGGHGRAASRTRSYTPRTRSYTPRTRSYTPRIRTYTPRTRSYTPRTSRTRTRSYTPRSNTRISTTHSEKRSEAEKDAFLRETGFPHGRPGYVVDHRVPLACGGADAPSNMQWQTVEAAKLKDKTERIGCK